MEKNIKIISFFDFNSQNKRNIVMDFISLVVIVLLFVFLFNEAINYFGMMDESFYITVPHRVFLGESLLIDEWQSSQFSSFFQYPFLWIFIKITGSTEGIILFFRTVYIFFQLLTGYIIYTKLKAFNYLLAIIAMLMFVLYMPVGIMQLSYYTEGVLCAQLVSLLIFTTNKRGFFRCFFTGFLTGVAVTAQPAAAIIYFLYTIVVFIYYIYTKKNEKKVKFENYLNVKLWIYLTLGIVFCAIIFLIYLTQNADLKDIIFAFTNIFKVSDHEIPFSKNEIPGYEAIKALFSYNPVMFPVVIALLTFLIMDKKRLEHKKKWGIICYISIFLYYIEMFLTATTVLPFFFKPFPFFMLAFFSYLLTERKKTDLFFWLMMGIIYITPFTYVSEALEFSGAVGFVISNTAGLVLIYLFFEENIRIIYEKKAFINKKKRKKMVKQVQRHFEKEVLILLLCIFCLSLVFDFSTAFLFNMPSDAALLNIFGHEMHDISSEKIKKGPYRGIVAPLSYVEGYNDILEDLDYIKEEHNGSAFITHQMPWCYLYLETYNTYTAWYLDTDLQQYKQYFLQENNIPECVYIPDNHFYTKEPLSDATKIKEYVLENYSCVIKKGKFGDILIINDTM